MVRGQGGKDNGQLPSEVDTLTRVDRHHHQVGRVLSLPRGAGLVKTGPFSIMLRAQSVSEVVSGSVSARCARNELIRAVGFGPPRLNSRSAATASR